MVFIASLALGTIFIFQNCGQGFQTAQVNTKAFVPASASIIVNPNQALAYCSCPVSYADGISISGKAEFKRREIVISASSSLGLPGNPYPIQHSEIRVLDSKGQIVQCSETDDLGQFQLIIPKQDGAYQIEVNSRGQNSFLQAAVFKDELKTLYSLKHSISILGGVASEPKISFIAEADENLDPEVKGGAFHILDVIRKTNSWARSSFNYTVETYSPLAVYWVAGQTSAVKSLGYQTSLLDYASGSMNVIGGDQNDVLSRDTDHFDSSVLAYVYLPKVFADIKQSSYIFQAEASGLLQSALFIYFTTEILQSSHFVDTASVIGLGPMPFVNSQLADPQGSSLNNYLKLASLFYTLNNQLNIDVKKLLFDPAYQKLPIHTVTNFMSLIQSRSIDLGFSTQLASAISRASFILDTKRMGAELKLSVSPCQMNSIQLDPGYKENTSFIFHFNGTPSNLILKYSQGSSVPADLDLYVYAPNFNYLYDAMTLDLSKYSAASHLLKWSRKNNPSEESGSESVSFSASDKGDCIVNVASRTFVTSAPFQLMLDSQFLCPAE